MGFITFIHPFKLFDPWISVSKLNGYLDFFVFLYQPRTSGGLDVSNWGGEIFGTTSCE